MSAGSLGQASRPDSQPQRDILAVREKKSVLGARPSAARQRPSSVFWSGNGLETWHIQGPSESFRLHKLSVLALAFRVHQYFETVKSELRNINYSLLFLGPFCPDEQQFSYTSKRNHHSPLKTKNANNNNKN